MRVNQELSRILDRLAEAPHSIRIAPGLTESEFVEIEARYEIAFPPDLRALLAIGLPVEEPGASPLRGFPDWRNADVAILRDRLTSPVEDVLYAVRESDYWYRSWPSRPETTQVALDLAARELESVPRLVPVWGHRYIPSTPDEAGNPILSVVGVDVIQYGADLEDYFENEFFDKSNAFHRSGGRDIKVGRWVPFWSDVGG